MANYAIFGNAGAASTTAATAGILKVDNPSSTTMAGAKIYQFGLGPGANSADETYQIRIKRQTTAGTWTAVTPSPLDKASASVSSAGSASTAAGSAGVELWRMGYHMRAGLAWTFIPGGELINAYAFSNGLIAEYVFAQGTSVQGGVIYFSE